MGLGRIIVAAAAATPLVRDYLHKPQRCNSDSSETTIIAPRPSGPTSRPLPSAGSLESPTLGGEEMARRPLLEVDPQYSSRQSTGYGHNAPLGYGAIPVEHPSSLRTSPERYRRDSWLDRVPEEVTLEEADDEELQEAEEWDLAQQGYYSGSYKRVIALYALVPLTSIAVFLCLALLPQWTWPIHQPTLPTSPRSLPPPLPEFILSAALWSLSHLLRVPLYNLASLLCPRALDTLLFNLLHVLFSQLLRLVAVATLNVRHDMTHPRPSWHDGAFRTVWWLALGWGFAEAATSIAQGYQQLALYRNVMVPVERVREILAQSAAQAQWGIGSITGSGDGSREYMPLSPRTEHAAGLTTEPGVTISASQNDGTRRRKDPMTLEEAIRLAIDQDVEQLIHLQEREELEEVYGVPVVYIPVFVPCLQRVDSFLVSIGITLILAWAYLLSPFSFPPGSEPPSMFTNRPLAITFPLVVVVHLFLSLLHSTPILPRIGVHTTAYVGLLVGLGGFFTGLGLWGALS